MKLERFSYEFAMEEYRRLAEYLKKDGYTTEPSGSLRRGRSDVGDIDFLVLGERREILEVVGSYPEVERRISKYEFQLKSGICIHAIPEVKEKYNFTLWQSTGPKKHVKWIKEIYRERERELRRENIEEREVYTEIGLEYIEPENRYRYQGDIDDQEAKNKKDNRDNE